MTAAAEMPEDIRRAAAKAFPKDIDKNWDMDTPGALLRLKASIRNALCGVLLADRQRDQWRPIDTAPRDGTTILLVGGVYGGLPFPGKWDKSEFVSPVARWFSSISKGYLYKHVPTHWQPLPAAPKGGAE